jgi:hypothetical protein
MNPIYKNFNLFFGLLVKSQLPLAVENRRRGGIGCRVHEKN